MEPLPQMPQAGKFPLLMKFRLLSAACGYLVTPDDHILLSFDKAEPLR
jgi:OmpA-OmpF porin, OOP family